MTDRRDRYGFHERRDGDVITVATETDRKRVISAFVRWKKRRMGDLRAKSRKTPDGYEIVFTGTSPTEAVREYLKGDI